MADDQKSAVSPIIVIQNGTESTPTLTFNNCIPLAVMGKVYWWWQNDQSLFKFWLWISLCTQYDVVGRLLSVGLGILCSIFLLMLFFAFCYYAHQSQWNAIIERHSVGVNTFCAVLYYIGETALFWSSANALVLQSYSSISLWLDLPKLKAVIVLLLDYNSGTSLAYTRACKRRQQLSVSLYTASLYCRHSVTRRASVRSKL